MTSLRVARFTNVLLLKRDELIQMSRCELICPWSIGGRTMRFVVGQAFESAVSGRQAVVAETRDGGHAGHLRFLDSGQQQWFLWAQFLHAGEWMPIGMKDASKAEQQR